MQLYFYWLTLTANEPSSGENSSLSSSTEFISKFDSITNDNQITLSLVRAEKIESRGQSILMKQKILCKIAEIETLKEKMKRLKQTPLPMHKSPIPVQVILDDE